MFKIWGRSDQWLLRYSTFNIFRSFSLGGHLHWEVIFIRRSSSILWGVAEIFNSHYFEVIFISSILILLLFFHICSIQVSIFDVSFNVNYLIQIFMHSLMWRALSLCYYDIVLLDHNTYNYYIIILHYYNSRNMGRRWRGAGVESRSRFEEECEIFHVGSFHIHYLIIRNDYDMTKLSQSYKVLSNMQFLSCNLFWICFYLF